MGRTGEKVSIQIHAELFKICEKIFKQFVCVSALFLSDFKRSFLSTMWQPTLRIVILSKNITKTRPSKLCESQIFTLLVYGPPSPRPPCPRPPCPCPPCPRPPCPPCPRPPWPRPPCPCPPCPCPPCPCPPCPCPPCPRPPCPRPPCPCSPCPCPPIPCTPHKCPRSPYTSCPCQPCPCHHQMISFQKIYGLYGLKHYTMEIN